MYGSQKREIIVFSDSHGRSDGIVAAAAMHPTADVIHLGDGVDDVAQAHLTGRRIWCVRGNCEEFSFSCSIYGASPRELLIETCGLKIFAIHGNRENVKYGIEKAVCSAASHGADILLFGHTHVPYEDYIPSGTEYELGAVLSKPLRILNPGSIGKGHPYPSYGLITICGKNVILSHGQVK